MSKQSAESVSLSLDNRNCYANPKRSNAVFRINWPMVLGDMYRKYDKFKMVINNYYYCPGTARTGTFTQQMLLKMTGLNFINSCSGGSSVGVGRDADSGISGTITGISNGEATLQSIDMGIGDLLKSHGCQFGNDGDAIIFNVPSPTPQDILFVLRDYRQNNTPPSIVNDMFIFVVNVTIYGPYD